MANRKRSIGIPAAIFILLVVLFAEACKKPAEKSEEKEPETVAPVQTAAVRQGPIHRIVQAQAILYPANQAAITPKIGAPIGRFYVNRGDHIRKGQLIAELENRDLAAAVTAAKGNVDQATANYRNTTAAALPDEIAKSQSDVQAGKELVDVAQKLYESRKKLFDDGALPRKQLDEAQVSLVQVRNQYEIARKHLDSLQQAGKEAQTKAAQAQIEAAKGQHEAAQAQLEYSKIISPIDGVVADRPFYAGEIAGAGMPMLTIVDISSVIARASVPVGDLSFIKVGNDATIIADGFEVRGKVTVVSPALDPNSTTTEVWVQAANPGERLRPGATVRVSIVVKTISDALLIPLSAILPSQGNEENTVLVVGADSLAQERKIETGIREGDNIQVLKGLAPGEQVITVGGYGVKEIKKVKVENANTKAKTEE
jgi:multidrug efflux pump subunit AcrA (membrane-fusion protein)